jgi:DNA polymerase-4/DNA polymerase V
MGEPLTLASYPRAILHIDGDSFFASCEVAKDPSLRGKAVVTGRERGIASAMTYEAKARGVTRGMRLSEIRKVCPEAVILPSDYETYSLYSKRMFEIVRRYTPEVEEYSIDECFADLTGLRRPLRKSYGQIAQAIKHDLDLELGMTFSVGLAPTKVLAKVASKWKKPSGLTLIPGNRAHEYLAQLAVGKLWGVGPQTTALLQKYGVRTADEFARKDEAWVRKLLTKPHIEIWRELHGDVVYELVLTEKHDYQSISKTKTFTPASSNPDFVFSQLSKNIENACIKARRHGLVAREVLIFLKTQEFRYRAYELKLSTAVSVPHVIVGLVRESFDVLFQPGILYRATGVVLCKLQREGSAQLDLFDEATRIERMAKVYEAVDALSQKYGKHTVYLAASSRAMTTPSHKGDRSVVAARKTALFTGETARRRLGVPMLGEAS